MDTVFIIGLPKTISRRVQAELNKNDIRLKSILCDIGKEGSLVLLPYPKQAIYDLRSYIDDLANIDDSYIVALPYAPLPKDLELELDTVEDLGGTTIRVSQGEDGWKRLTTKRPDDSFLNAVCQRLLKEVLPEGLPSDYFRSAADTCPQLIFTDNVYDVCDQVAEHRYEFFRKATDALTELVITNGQVGNIDIYYKKWGLEYAQTGGIKTTLRVRKKGNSIYEKTSTVHLKQGDKTTPQAAARIYYHSFQFDDRYFIVVMYAGPHPEEDINLIINLP